MRRGSGILITSCPMKKPIHCIFCLLVVALVLISQFGAAFDIDDNDSVVIEEVSDSWFASGDINDDIDDIISRIFNSPSDIHYCFSLPLFQLPVFNDLILQSEARAPPVV